jgi:alpha-beta hydrolase superfamily lysophospholipase
LGEEEDQNALSRSASFAARQAEEEKHALSRSASFAARKIEVIRAGDGYKWYAHIDWCEQPKGIVVLLHGIRSHAGWYIRTRTALAEAGYEVHFLDRRGSGLNTAHRGDTPNFRRLIQDVVEYVRELRQSRNSLPVFLGGISWGGKLALGVAAEQPGLVNGVALVCPGLVAKVRPPLVSRLRILLARFLRPTKRFPIPLNDPELFTAQPHWQQYITNDPQGLGEATARFLFESVRFDLHLRRSVKRVVCPVLLMLAGQDRILNNPATRKYLAKLSNARSVHIIDDPAAHHTLEFEEDPSRYLQQLIGWLHAASVLSHG